MGWRRGGCGRRAGQGHSCGLSSSSFLPRGRGLGLIMALGALGGLSGPAQRLHMGHGAFLQHVVLAACALLCILSIMLLPETKRKLLPEVLRDGELCRRPSLLRQPPPTRCDHVPLLATPNPAL